MPHEAPDCLHERVLGLTIWLGERCGEEFCMRSQYLLLSCLFAVGEGEGAGEDHVVPGAKAVPITGRQVNGLAALFTACLSRPMESRKK